MDLGHSSPTRRFWRRLVRRSLALGATTPFYLCSVEPLRAALDDLVLLGQTVPLPVRHWLSCKTQPVPPLLRWWRRQGRPIEVVSELEFLAARAEGFAAEDILVNGPAKDRWLPRHPAPRLRVNFDSLRELECLLPLARRLDWSVGIRCLTAEEYDPEHPPSPTQFGLGRADARRALDRLRAAGVRLETVHFHLRTNVHNPRCYERAIREVAALCRSAGFRPAHLDCGGGLPPPHVRARDGLALDRRFTLSGFAKVLRQAVPLFPGLRELWLENGRFLSARSGVLVARIIEVKERRGLRQILCDGGRTLHALISNWEDHGLVSLSARRGRRVKTVVYGPTCMAFDQLTRRSMPATLAVGDHLIWLDAGAYHLPWETQFSHGCAAVWWHEDATVECVRPAATFASWWSRWKSPVPHPPRLGLPKI